MMADVACFCGSLYSFEGSQGACPKCGEIATLTTGSGFQGAEADPDLLVGMEAYLTSRA